MQREHQGRRRREGGFTLVELGVVLAVLAILVAIALPTYLNMVNRAREAEAQQAWAMVKTELWAYYVQHNKFPAAPQGGWWPGIDEPKSDNWAYSASGDEDTATLIATGKKSAAKLCWTLKTDGTVDTNCPSGQ